MLSLIGASAGFAPALLRTSALHVAPRFPVSMKLEEESNILVKSLRTFRGVVTPTRIEQPSAPSQAKKEEEKEEMSIKELLTEYGVIALAFHFTVWITCLTTCFAIFSVGLDVSSLPEWLVPEGGEGAAEAGGFAARAAATLGVVEAIGPARLALTVAATPKISPWARQFELVQDIETRAEGLLSSVFGGDKAKS